jgi:phosphatidylglycerol---prolipoprotein diacylglyceryl transferase
MHPILIQFFGFSIHSYGVMLAIGFMIGISLAVRESQRTGVDPEKVLNLSFWILITSIVGARLFHCIVFYPEYVREPLRIFKLWEGGLVFYGGFIGAVLASIVYCKIHKLNFWQISDIMIPSVMIGLMFGRLGCFLAGCCFGKACAADFAFCITFKNPLGLGIKDVPLYPTQLMSAGNALIIFLLLWSYRKHKRFHGELLGIALLVYSITRFLIEIIRDDPRGFVTLGTIRLSESQFASLFIGLFALYILVFIRNRQSQSSRT